MSHCVFVCVCVKTFLIIMSGLQGLIPVPPKSDGWVVGISDLYTGAVSGDVRGSRHLGMVWKKRAYTS